MALTGVKISEETYLTCLTHALSTETEEIMGLLLGDIEYLEDGSAIALVWWAAPQTSEDANKVGRIQVIAFQSQDGLRRDYRSQGVGSYDSAGDSSRSAPVAPSISESEIHSTPKASSSGNKQQSAALENLFAIADSEARGAAGTSTSEDESLSMQEAMHLSNLEASGAEFVRKEIPLEVVPGNSLVKLAFPLAPLVELQRTLFQEEHAAFRQAIAQSTVNGQIHPLAVFHHEAQYQATLSKLMEYCLCPALQTLMDKNQQNKIRLGQMQDDPQALHLQRIAISSKTGSPRSPQAVGRSPSHRAGGGSSSSSGRLSSEVFSPTVRRSTSSGHRGAGDSRSAQEGKPASPDLIRF
ncbi:hypothetical protein AXG93_2018s1600 [Marchantia polymorpha subsp. ruderalis]|uniref:BRCC36 C-terminal helical domain-containing protein n=1 Tax=Marchantia polymorpha subsp. ruderalis TaxID=1480154 RepID=A0A176WED7_MARPO|nr:hypothetical protein AXG93_2018s1600 [Marchantia polymorpha subsp. ruderalis]